MGVLRRATVPPGGRTREKAEHGEAGQMSEAPQAGLGASGGKLLGTACLGRRGEKLGQLKEDELFDQGDDDELGDELDVEQRVIGFTQLVQSEEALVALEGELDLPPQTIKPERIVV